MLFFPFFSCSGHVQVLDAMWLLGERIGKQTGKTAGGHNGENMCRFFGWRWLKYFLTMWGLHRFTVVPLGSQRQRYSDWLHQFVAWIILNIRILIYLYIYIFKWENQHGQLRVVALQRKQTWSILEWFGVWKFQARGDPMGSAAAPLPAATMGEVP
jgi:hypothetical protein